MLSVCLPWAAGRAEEAIRADYRCLGRFDASDVTALFFRRSPAEVVLLEGLQAVRLPQALAASGARYSDGRDSFWVKGDQASWSRGKAPTRQCIPRP
ncbi:MAG: MliC family protein [Synechococcaceae cyanobacterium]|nr:MliC family protein [Synechococcaceae cyanobacterium]